VGCRYQVPAVYRNPHHILTKKEPRARPNRGEVSALKHPFYINTYGLHFDV
jgi:hypothetical protein